MKDQFKKLVQDKELDDRLDLDFDEAEEEEHNFAGFSTNARLVDRGDRTNQEYFCYVVECGDCEAEILYVLQTEYHLVVGSEHTVPMELCWTECDWEVGDADEVDDRWDESESFVSSDAALLICDCGTRTPVRFGVDGGLCISPTNYPLKRVQVAKSRLPYRTEPKDDWDIKDF